MSGMLDYTGTQKMCTCIFRPGSIRVLFELLVKFSQQPEVEVDDVLREGLTQLQDADELLLDIGDIDNDVILFGL